MKFNSLLVLALAVAIVSPSFAQTNFSKFSLTRGQAGTVQRLTETPSVPSLMPVDGTPYTHTVLLGTDPASPDAAIFAGSAVAITDATIDGLAEAIGLDLNEIIMAGTGADILSTDDVSFIGPDAGGMNEFQATFTLEATGTISLEPGGFTVDPDMDGVGTALDVLGIGLGAIFADADMDGNPDGSTVQFVDPVFVTSGNLELLDAAGASLTMDAGIDIPVDMFFQDLDALPDGSWDGNLFAVLGVGSAGTDSVFTMVLTINYLTDTPGDMTDCIIGDLNDDGAVDLLDVEPFVDAILAGIFSCPADINEDGNVDLLDVSPFITILLGG